MELHFLSFKIDLFALFLKDDQAVSNTITAITALYDTLKDPVHISQHEADHKPRRANVTQITRRLGSAVFYNPEHFLLQIYELVCHH